MVKGNAKEKNFKVLRRLVDEIFEKHREFIKKEDDDDKENAGI